MGMYQGTPGAAHAAGVGEQSSGNATSDPAVIKDNSHGSRAAGRLRQRLAETGQYAVAEGLRLEFSAHAS